jgi:hypothetical protein
MLKIFLILVLLFFSGRNTNSNIEEEYKIIYSEPLYIDREIDGQFTFDLSTVDLTIKVKLVVPIKTVCKKDTIIIKEGYKKF